MQYMSAPSIAMYHWGTNSKTNSHHEPTKLVPGIRTSYLYCETAVPFTLTTKRDYRIWADYRLHFSLPRI